MSDPTDYHWRQLCCTIIARAVKDAESANPGRAVEAREWLQSGAADLLDALDIPPSRVARWVRELTPVAQLSLEL